MTRARAYIMSESRGMRNRGKAQYLRDRKPTPSLCFLRSGRDQASSWARWTFRRETQHLGRNLRFKGSPLCDRPRSNILRRQCRSVGSEHACPVLGQRTTVVIEQIPCLCGLCADISVRNVKPHDARTRVTCRFRTRDRPDHLQRDGGGNRRGVLKNPLPRPIAAPAG